MGLRFGKSTLTASADAARQLFSRLRLLIGLLSCLACLDWAPAPAAAAPPPQAPREELGTSEVPARKANGDAEPEAALSPPGDAEASFLEPGSAAGERTSLNLLGEVDTASGEARRNENVRITLIDNYVLKELNVRMGPTATIFEEFRVDQSYFGAEFGGEPSAPLHLPASSFTGLHGHAFWTHNNSFFSARSFFQVGDVQPARTNDYGLLLSAPLSGGAGLALDAGGRRLRGQVNGNVLVPSPAERTPLAADPARRRIVERILAAFGPKFPNRTDIDPRALNTNAPQSIDNDNMNVLIDLPREDRDHFILRYGLTLQNVEAFQLVGGQNPDTTTRNHQARITWNRAWTPLTLFDASIGYDRIGSLLVPEETSLGPLHLFGRQLQSIGPTSSVPIDRVQNVYRYAAQVRRFRGDHNLHLGLEVLRRQVNGLESADHRGTFSFRNDFGNDTITNLRLGMPSEYWIAAGNVHRGFRNWDLQYFAGDAWRVHRDLTVNFGLRYQPVTRPTEVNDLSDIPYDCDCNNLAPRFGFSYRLSDRWGILRGAYGVHFGEIFPVTFGQARFNPPANLRLSLQVPDLINPQGALDSSDLDPGARSAVFRLDPELVAPYSHQYNFGWNLSLAQQWRLELGYVGSRSHRLLTTWFLNRARPVDGVPLTTETINERRPDPNFFEVRHILNGSRGYYDAGKVTLTIPAWSGFSVNASYWFSKAIDLGADYVNTASGRDAREARSPSEFNYHGEMRGLSAFDQPHAFLWRVHYETGQPAAPGGWIRRIFGRWQIDSVILWKSGTPFNVQSGSDAPGFGNVDGASSDRPNLVDPAVLGRTIDNPDTSASLLPRSAFSFIGPSDPGGNLGRNTFRKDEIWNVNTELSRRWMLSGDQYLLFRAASLNFLNHPQFDEPGSELSSPNFGQITNTLNDGRTFTLTLEFGF